MSHHAELQRVLDEADLATGMAAQRFLPGFSRKHARYSALLADSRNPLLRRFYAWRAEHYRRLAAEAKRDIDRAGEVRTSRHGGLLPRR